MKSNTAMTLHGIVSGRNIQLVQATDLKDGTEVEVVVREMKPLQAWGEGLRRCAGALADDWTVEDDRILAENR